MNLVEWGISVAVMPRVGGSTLSLAGSGRRSIVAATAWCCLKQFVANINVFFDSAYENYKKCH